MSAGVTFSILAAQVRMGVWLQVNCRRGERYIRVTKEERGCKGPNPGALCSRGPSSH